MLIKWFLKIVMTLLLIAALFLLLLAFMPTRWLADKIEDYGSNLLNAHLTIGTLDLNVFSATPGINLNKLQLESPMQNSDNAQFSAERISGTIELKHLLLGDIVVGELVLEDADIDMSVDEAGAANWSFLAPTKSEKKSATEPVSVPAIRRIDLQNVNVNFIDVKNNRNANLVVRLKGSTINNNQPMTVSAAGMVNETNTEFTAEIASLATMQIPPESFELAIDVKLGNTQMAVNGKAETLQENKNIDVEFSVSGNGLEDLENISGIELPTLPPFSITGDSSKDGEYWVLRRFDGLLGNSDIEGDIKINPSTTPVTLYANIISKELDLDDLAGLLGGTPNPDEPAINNQQTETETEPEPEPENTADSDKLLPDRELDLRPLIGLFNGAVQYRSEAVSSPTWPIETMDIRAEINGTDVAITPLTIGLAGGAVSGAVYLDLAAQPMKSQLEVDIKRVNLRQVLSSAGVDDDSFGLIGGKAKFWASGDTMAQLAASADGGLFLLMTKGKLDALLTELAGIDITETLVLLIDPEKIRTDVNCAYLDILSKDGVVEISTLVMDTDDSVILAEGSVNLNDETLDLIVEPHPKDFSVLAAQTAVYIDGTFMDINVAPGRTLFARAGAAALLAAIASPAAALIPFIEAGTGNDSAYCTGMVTALDDAR